VVSVAFISFKFPMEMINKNSVFIVIKISLYFTWLITFYNFNNENTIFLIVNLN
jgi:hypothetical protein